MATKTAEQPGIGKPRMIGGSESPGIYPDAGPEVAPDPTEAANSEYVRLLLVESPDPIQAARIGALAVTLHQPRCFTCRSCGTENHAPTLDEKVAQHKERLIVRAKVLAEAEVADVQNKIIEKSVEKAQAKRDEVAERGGFVAFFDNELGRLIRSLSSNRHSVYVKRLSCIVPVGHPHRSMFDAHDKLLAEHRATT